MIDIDYFNNFNGHLAGDDCLRQIAIALKETLKRPADFIARYGGEEFVILLPETAEKGAAHIADLLQANVKKLNLPYIATKKEPIVSISLGCATLIPNEKMIPEDLIQLADFELYQAKKADTTNFSLINSPPSIMSKVGFLNKLQVYF
jgi:diguanylate cyclase (GGDEF)-like protein